MEAFYQSEIDLIVALQASADVATPMRWASYLGWDGFWLVLPCVYLCFDRKVGARLFLLFYLNVFLINVLKLAFHSPRPFWLDPGVQVLAGSANYGFPSGHVQMATAVWFFLAWNLRTPLGWLAATTLVLCVSISRVYLGVHFMSDVVGGWVLGGLVLLGFVRVVPAVESCFAERRLAVQIGLAVAAAALVFCLGLLAQDLFLPLTSSPWTHLAANGYSLGWPCATAGGILGAGVGIAMTKHLAGSGITHPPIVRGIGFLYFIALNYLIRSGAGWLSAEVTESLWNVAGLVREFLTTWLIIFCAPWALRWSAQKNRLPGRSGLRPSPQGSHHQEKELNQEIRLQGD